MPQQDQFFISHKLSGISILLWLISIPLPGLVFYNREVDFSYGFQILLFGWIGILGTYVGWVANIFWLVAIERLRRGKRSALTIAILATLFSLDTFRVDCVSMGGPCNAPYGLGIGGAIWLIAILLSLFAAAIRDIEIENNDLLNFVREHPSFTRKIGALFSAAKAVNKTIPLMASLILLIGFAVIAVTLGIHNRIVGNADEQDMLKKGAIFKRTAICGAAPEPIEKIHMGKDGVLEVVTTIYSDVLSKDPVMYLRLGIPVVRSVTLWDKVPQDRYLKYPPHIETMKSRPVMGKPDARLETTGEPGSYNIKLRDKNGKVLLDVTQENNCPKINSFSHYSTEKLVRQALILPSDE